MKNRAIHIMCLICFATSLTSCGVKTAVPGFEYPVYAPDKKWPKLAPTAELEQKTDVDVEAVVEDVERLKRLPK
jgi:hypothetical protein